MAAHNIYPEFRMQNSETKSEQIMLIVDWADEHTRTDYFRDHTLTKEEQLLRPHDKKKQRQLQF